MPEPARRHASATWRSSCTRHMPYVEGFGTYPFGEEWLFDAVVRSYLPVLEVAERPDVTVTPGARRPARGAGRRASACGAFLRELPDRRRRGRRRRRAAPSCRDGLRRPRRSATARALELLDALGGDLAARRSASAAREGRVELVASAATHAVLPLLATRAGRRLQLDAGHALAPAPLRLGRRLLAARVRLRARARGRAGRAGRRAGSASTRARHERAARRRSAPVAHRGRPGGAADRLGGGRAGSGRSTAIPPTPPTPSSPASRCAGSGSGRSAAGAYDPEAAAARRPARRPASSSPPSPPGCARFAAERGRRGLLVFAIDTELLGHWWSEGPVWLARGARRAPRRAGCGCVTARRRRSPSTSREARPLRASTWGEGKDLAHLGLAGGRRPRLGARGGSSCGCCGRSRGGLRGAGARARRARAARRCRRATGPSSTRGQAGDYAYQRATDHAEAAAGGHRLRRQPPTRACASSPRT